MYRYMQLDMHVLGCQPNLIEFSPSLASNTNNFEMRSWLLFFSLSLKKKLFSCRCQGNVIWSRLCLCKCTAWLGSTNKSNPFIYSFCPLSLHLQHFGPKFHCWHHNLQSVSNKVQGDYFPWSARQRSPLNRCYAQRSSPRSARDLRVACPDDVLIHSFHAHFLSVSNWKKRRREKPAVNFAFRLIALYFCSLHIRGYRVDWGTFFVLSTTIQSCAVVALHAPVT